MQHKNFLYYESKKNNNKKQQPLINFHYICNRCIQHIIHFRKALSWYSEYSKKNFLQKFSAHFLQHLKKNVVLFNSSGLFVISNFCRLVDPQFSQIWKILAKTLQIWAIFVKMFSIYFFMFGYRLFKKV